MGKVLLYASIAVTLATAALGFINKGKLDKRAAELSKSTDDLAKSEKAVKDKTAAIEKVQNDLKDSTEKLTSAIADAEKAKADLEKSKKDLVDMTTERDAKTTKIAELEAKIAEIKAKPPEPGPGNTGDDTVKRLESELAEAKVVNTELNTKVVALQERVTKLTDDNARRTALKMRNGLEGRILAVNQAWNFVVLNLGDKNGVVGNAEMLIKRGSQLVGKVRVTSVEPSTSIADIVASSVPRGVSIQPGDNVIYQATAE